ncbi:hypothetical protein ACFX2I_004750 [Malus domestica]|uniref:pterin-4-alpha-carbinolamine dehydratase 2, mitochondrial-like isoform X1 n=1 Tax=Malus domestica TaxID=3750 RepID=UPI000498CB04|nr:pterin-4-alpha-carbinolamine dehydratase 2, mitochondrial-like isoform X1 [Malus domestica]
MSRLLQKVPLASVIQSFTGTHGRFVCQGSHIFLILYCFLAALDLLIKKCVSCDSKDMRPMTEQAAKGLITKVDGWNLVSEGDALRLKRSWTVKTFTKGLDMLKLVADVAEAEGHHPDLHLVGWNNVTVEIWTHAVGGLTENDFILAAKINRISMQHLLRRKATD